MRSFLFSLNVSERFALIAGVFGLLAGITEALHPNAGLFPAGVATGLWFAAALLWASERVQ